jgi:hypothetical protein
MGGAGMQSILLLERGNVRPKHIVARGEDVLKCGSKLRL